MKNEPISFEVLHPEPLLIVISGPSGVGKDSVVKELLRRNDSLDFVVTATSRTKREKEQNGVDYFFVTKEEFERMKRDNELLEDSLVYGQYKGIPKKSVLAVWARGKDVILRIDFQGAMKIKNLYPETLMIFLLPTSEDELRNRLIDRKTETPETIELRMATTRKEMESISIFDYMVYNPHGKMNEAVRNIETIIKAEHLRVNQRKVRI
jgi:guanylate kinase